MRRWVKICLIFVSFGLIGCKEKPTEVEIAETRELSRKDGSPKLFPTSSEQFEGTPTIVRDSAGEAKQGTIKGSTPQAWRRARGNSFRLLNFTIGANAEAEVYLSKSRGTIPANVSRWMQQFGVTDFTLEQTAKLPRKKLGPFEGVLVEAEGDFSPGNGRPGKEDQALIGLIAEDKGVIWTLKMTGEKKLVHSQKETFLNFAQSLELSE